MPDRPATDRSYHHGDLRRAAIDEAVALITESGITAVGLRQIARRIGVTHTSIAHHLEDKTGLFTAVATEGFRRLCVELAGADAGEGQDPFVELGVAYARFAAANPAHFEVMFRADLHRSDDPDLLAAVVEATELLHGRAAAYAGPDDDPRLVGIAGWALMHGLAELWRNGALDPDLGEDLETVARRVGLHLLRR